MEPDETIPYAAAWLDETYPGWETKVDLENFDMGDATLCIAGYLNIDWWYDLKLPFEKDTNMGGTGIFSSFNGAWENQILNRRVNER